MKPYEKMNEKVQELFSVKRRGRKEIWMTLLFKTF